jgi:hypothetical protein
VKTEVAATIAEVVTRYAKHGSVKTEVAPGYAKHGNVKTEATAMIAEVAPGYAKHGNVKTEVAAMIAEVAPFDLLRLHSYHFFVKLRQIS